jgi:hypothetical protein
MTWSPDESCGPLGKLRQAPALSRRGPRPCNREGGGPSDARSHARRTRADRAQDGGASAATKIYELNAVIYDRRLAQELEAAFERDLEGCEMFSLDEYKHRLALNRLRDSAAPLPSPLL